MAHSIKWGAELLRLTTLQEGASVPGAWKLVTDVEPETSTKNNRAQTSEEAGEFEGLNLKHVSLPGRDDWLVTPLAPNNTATIQPFDIEAGLRVLDAVAKKWFPTLTPAPARLAFGAALFDAPTNDRVEGYEHLSEFLKDVKLDPRSEDFTYQINWPRAGRAVDTKINRLSKWAVLVRTSQPIAIFSGHKITIGQPQAMVFQPHLELDISSDAARTAALPSDKLEALWSELTSLGIEISREGNIP
jgi:hypothetical protein